MLRHTVKTLGPLVLYSTTRLRTCSLILKGETRRICTFATLSEMEVTRQEQRSYVKIAVLRGRNAKECHSELTEALDNRALPYRTVARWTAAFQRGRVGSADMRRTGRPRTVRTNVARAVIAQCSEYDRRWSLQELQAHTDIDQATVHKTLREDVHLRKIAAKWLPLTLTEQQKWCLYETCRIHLERYQNEGEKLLNNIITIDEMGQGLRI